MESTVVGNWHQSIESFSYSTEEFYDRLERTLTAQNIPNLKMERAGLPEGGFLSAYRLYLQLKRGNLTFYVCAAPFGVNFFVSWWLMQAGDGCLQGCATTFLPFLTLLKRQRTFYEEDTAVMFREAMHEAVLSVLREVLGDGGKARVERMRAPTVAKSLV